MYISNLLGVSWKSSYLNRTSNANDIALLQLEDNPRMQWRLDDESNPHVAMPMKLCPKG